MEDQRRPSCAIHCIKKCQITYRLSDRDSRLRPCWSIGIYWAKCVHKILTSASALACFSCMSFKFAIRARMVLIWNVASICSDSRFICSTFWKHTRTYNWPMHINNLFGISPYTGPHATSLHFFFRKKVYAQCLHSFNALANRHNCALSACTRPGGFVCSPTRSLFASSSLDWSLWMLLWLILCMACDRVRSRVNSSSKSSQSFLSSVDPSVTELSRLHSFVSVSWLPEVCIITWPAWTTLVTFLIEHLRRLSFCIQHSIRRNLAQVSTLNGGGCCKHCGVSCVLSEAEL